MTGGSLATLMSSPLRRDECLTQLAARLSGLDLTALVAVGVAPLWLASGLAGRLRLPMVYIRDQPKQHGTRRQMEGQLTPGSRAFVVAQCLPNDRDVTAAIALLAQSNVATTGCLIAEGAADEYALAAGELRARGVNVLFVNDEYRATGSTAPLLMNPADGVQDASAGNATHLRESVARILLDIGAITINYLEPFTYVSGLRSPIYADNRLLISHPVVWQTVVDAFASKLKERVGRSNVDGVVGTATSGIPHATLIADRLGLPLIYVDGAAEGEGSIVGSLTRDQRLVVIEDHVTTGKSVLETTQVVRRHGGRVDWCLAILTYDFHKAADKLQQEALRFDSLCDLNTLLAIGVKSRHLDDVARKAVLDWAADPAGWSQRVAS